MTGRMLGRYVGSRRCTCFACPRPDVRADRRRQRQREKCQWQKEQQR